MADFYKVYNKVVNRYEGGFAKNLKDPGGITYKGISRRYYPNWEGWGLVGDLYFGKNDPMNFVTKVKIEKELEMRVVRFYKHSIWAKIKGDILPQVIANEVFDQAVIFGCKRAIVFLQMALNLFLSPPLLKVDGLFGHKTLEGINRLSKINDHEAIVKVLNIWQGFKFITTKNPNRKTFLRGWLKRVEIKD